MKNIKKIAAALLLVSLVFVLVSCSTFGSIKSNFTKGGYTEVKSEDAEDEALTASLVVAELEDGDITCTTHVFKKEGAKVLGITTYKYAIILEFKSEADLEKAFGDSATLKGLVKDLQNSDYVNGNCVLIPSLLDNQEKVDLFKK